MVGWSYEPPKALRKEGQLELGRYMLEPYRY